MREYAEQLKLANQAFRGQATHLEGECLVTLNMAQKEPDYAPFWLAAAELVGTELAATYMEIAYAEQDDVESMRYLKEAKELQTNIALSRVSLPITLVERTQTEDELIIRNQVVRFKRKPELVQRINSLLKLV